MYDFILNGCVIQPTCCTRNLLSEIIMVRVGFFIIAYMVVM